MPAGLPGRDDGGEGVEKGDQGVAVCDRQTSTACRIMGRPVSSRPRASRAGRVGRPVRDREVLMDGEGLARCPGHLLLLGGGDQGRGGHAASPYLRRRSPKDADRGALRPACSAILELLRGADVVALRKGLDGGLGVAQGPCSPGTRSRLREDDSPRRRAARDWASGATGGRFVPVRNADPPRRRRSPGPVCAA